MNAEKIRARAQELADELSQTRREIHSHPELAFCEQRTARLICSRLEQIGIEFEVGIGETGVAGLIRGSKPGRTLLLRADMDALPVTELTGVPYASQSEGIMHACGHDSHVACLLGVARILQENRDHLCGNVKLMFQPAEEDAGGAMPMIEDGLMESPHVDAALALHVEPTFDCGTVALKGGATMASPDEFDIIIRGKGGHGAYPHNTADPIVAAARVVDTLQSIVARNIDPNEAAVISVCKLQAGNFYNVIPDEATIGGTARAISRETRNLLENRIGQVARGVCEAMGVDCEYQYRHVFSPLINDAGMTDLIRRVAGQFVGPENVLPLDAPFMGGDDFSYVAERVPACYFYLGCRNGEKGCIYPWHSARFNLDEDCMPLGVAILAYAAVAYLNETQIEQGGID